jgi:hypothetical protein
MHVTSMTGVLPSPISTSKHHSFPPATTASRPSALFGGSKELKQTRKALPSARPFSTRTNALFGGGSNNKEMKQTKKGFSRRSKSIEERPQTVQYGSDWYAQTREAAKPRRTTREEMEYRRQANLAANNGKDRKDLYTDNWDGDKYKGNPVNILSVLIVISILVPVAGLVFAFNTYGKLWG